MTSDPIDYDLLPAHLREGMRRYFEHGIETGSFLRAVLERDFERSALLSDPESAAGELGIARFLSGAPEECWGSPAKVQAWIDEHRPHRKDA